MKRSATIKRKTKETQIELQFNLDGTGKSDSHTGIGFLDHMLTLFSKHGLFDLTVQCKGDLEVDFHHTVEDVGICLGQAFKKALGTGEGIVRYASQAIPMDETLCNLAMDISGRPFLRFEAPILQSKVGEFDTELAEEFFKAFVTHAGMSLHLTIDSGKNLHHIIEACFKAFGIVLDRATQKDPRKKGVPSTKGIL